MDILLLGLIDEDMPETFLTRDYLGLGYLAAVLLQHGYKVEIIDFNQMWPEPVATREAMTRILADNDPALIGISILYPHHVPEAMKVITALRQAGIDPHVCCGGPYATLAHRYLLSQDMAPDSIVCGEGEQTFLELVTQIMHGEDWKSILGIAFRRGSQVVTNPPRPPLNNLDELPFPVRKRSAWVGPHDVGVEISSSRGCYGTCTYCYTKPFYRVSKGKPWRYRTPQNVVDEIEQLVKEQKTSSFFFVDDNFIGPGRLGRERARGIAAEIRGRNLDIRFSIEARPNDIERSLFLSLMKAGLDHVYLGIESGVQSVLDRFQRGMTVEQNKTAIRTLKELGLNYDFGFLLFDPDTTLDELKENLRFLRETRLYHSRSPVAMLMQVDVFPRLDYEPILRSQGRLLGAPWPHYNYVIKEARVERIRRILSRFESRLLDYHKQIWPYTSLWDNWIIKLRRETQLSLSDLASVPSLNLSLGDQLKRWRTNLGVLILQVIENTVAAVEACSYVDDRIQDDLIQQTYDMLEHYNRSTFGDTFENALTQVKRLIYAHELSFSIGHQAFSISMDQRGD